MRLVSTTGTLCVVLCLGATTLAARQIASDDVFRVFLRDGQALQSYGEAMVVNDHLVFTLVVGDVAAGAPSLQLMSLPLVSVDLAHTTRYAEAKQAARYARTRGEADYAAVTAEVGRALQQLMAVDDSARRLALAEEARRRLLAWSRDHYRYRAGDIRELASLFDQVIAELGVAAGQSRFSLDLEAGPDAGVFEPLLPTLGLRQSIALALSAARATDVREERVAVLRAAAQALERAPGLDDLRGEVQVTLEAERRVDLAYAALWDDALARLNDPRTRSSVTALRGLASDVTARDRAFGSQRPNLIEALDAKIADALAAAAAHEQALARYRKARPSLVRYQRGVSPVTAGLMRLTPLLEAVRDARRAGYAELDRASRRLVELSVALRKVAAPPDFERVQASFEGALLLARQACDLKRQAAVTSSLATARSASSAAAGALLLFEHARAELAQGLRPPAIQ
jgi:hypothetical protein